MQSAVEFHHIKKRLTAIHLTGVGAFVAFFLLLFFMGTRTTVDTFAAQTVLLMMAGLTLISYTTVVFTTDHVPSAPIFFFFLLNIATSVLIWATGVLQSPFMILYIILIIVTSQLYHYAHGLVQTLIALAGFVFVYSATSFGLLPFVSLVPSTNVFFLYQPPIVMFVYGMLYAILFTFTVLSTSSARIILFRPSNKDNLDTTIHERIIHAMPLGVLVVDADLNILGANPAGTTRFPIHPSHATLDHYLAMNKTEIKNLLGELAKEKKETTLPWLLDTGETKQATFSVELHESEKKNADMFIIFIK